MKLTIGSLALLCLSMIPAAAQGVCSEQTTRGTYGLACEGYLTPAPGASLAVAKILGTCKMDPRGQGTCEGTLTLGGMILTQRVAGQVTVQPDCTGEARLTQTLNNQPAPNLNLKFFIIDGGKQVKAMAITPGTVLSCTKDRLSLN